MVAFFSQPSSVLTVRMKLSVPMYSELAVAVVLCESGRENVLPNAEDHE